MNNIDPSAAEIIPVKKKSKIKMNPAEIIPVEKKSKIEMNLAGRNNPCEEKEQDQDESGWPK